MESSHALYPLAVALQSATGQHHSELTVAALVAELIDPATGAEQVEDQVLDYLKGTSETTDTESLLAWFAEHGFCNGSPTVVTDDHSHLLRVIEQRQGIPITASVLLIAAARLAGIEAVGINQPGYFLVQLGADYYDPLTLKVVPHDEVSGAAASSEMLALRMINNLKGMAFAKSDLARALDLIDLQIYFVSDLEAKATLAFEQGEIWLKLGVPSAAKAAFERVLSWTNIPELKRESEIRMAELEGQSETWH